MAEIELEFLTGDETERDLCRQYWLTSEVGKFVHGVPHLADAFSVPRSKVAALVARACNAFCRDESCIECAAPRVYSSRSDYVERRRSMRHPAWECPNCKAAKQEAARRAKEADDRVRVELLQADLEHDRKLAACTSELSLRDAVFLVSVLRAGGAEDLSYVMPQEVFEHDLSPRPEFDREILTHLYQRRLLSVHPGSRLESITIDGGEFAQFVTFKVHWVLPLASTGPTPTKFLEELEARLQARPWSDAWTAESAELQHVVALQECLAYLELALDDHGFDARIGEKTQLVLRSALRDFSVAQVYNFIWRSAKDVAAFFMREDVARPHAANTVPGSIQRQAERALAEGWQVKPFRRDRRLPLSKLGHTLYTFALRLPDDGFTSVLDPTSAVTGTASASARDGRIA